ncbi:MAG: hypothetical protein ACP5I8_13970 [Phycisphaerae bacterium]
MRKIGIAVGSHQFPTGKIAAGSHHYPLLVHKIWAHRAAISQTFLQRFPAATLLHPLALLLNALLINCSAATAAAPRLITH